MGERPLTTLRVYFDSDRAGPKFERSVFRQADIVRQAARTTAKETADDILALGRADIQSAGRFGSRWTQGLHAEVTEGGGSIRIAVTHDVPYWRVFEKGAVIHGRPMLWIPLSFAADAQRVWARDYPGGLFRVDRPGKAPLLLSRESKEPKYFGKEFVTIPKKFHLGEITRKAARQMKELYRRIYGALKG